MGFFSGLFRGKGPQPALRGESPGFSLVAVGFLSSYDRDLRDPLMGPQGGPVSTRFVRGPSGFLCSLCRGRSPHLELRSEPQVSSPGLTWISVFLWGIHRGVRCVWSALGYLGSVEVWQDPWSSSQASSGDRLLLRYDRNDKIPSPTKQGNGPSSRAKEGEPGLFLSCGGTLGVPLECRRVCAGTS